MKFTANKKEILSVIKHLLDNSKKSTKNIYINVNGRLNLISVNDDILLKCSIDIVNQEAGEFLLTPEMYDYIKSLPKDITTITVNNVDTDITINQELFKTEQPSIWKTNLKPYINYITANVKSKFTINSLILNNLIETIDYATATSAIRLSLTGILVACTDVLTIAAGDGYRIAYASLPIKATDAYKVVVPPKVFEEFRKLLKKSVDVEVSLGDTFITLSCKDVVVQGRLINDEFPDFKIDTRNLTLSGEFSSSAVLKSIKELGKSKTSYLIITLSNDSIEAKVNESSATIPCVYSGDSVTVGVDAKHLLDYLSSIKGTVKINLLDNNSPIMFSHTITNYYTHTYIVSSVRI